MKFTSAAVAPAYAARSLRSINVDDHFISTCPAQRPPRFSGWSTLSKLGNSVSQASLLSLPNALFFFSLKNKKNNTALNGKDRFPSTTGSWKNHHDAHKPFKRTLFLYKLHTVTRQISDTLL